MPNSIHTARWISQLRDCGWDLHLYPGYFAQLHPEIKNVTYHLNKILLAILKIFLFLMSFLSKSEKISFLKPGTIKQLIDNRGCGSMMIC